MRFKRCLAKNSQRPALLLLLATCCWAQQQRLSVDPPQQITVKRGDRVTQVLHVSIQPGFHVNSNKPKDEYLIPLSLNWTGGPLTPEEISYPQAEQIKVGSDVLPVFTGKFDIKTEFKAADQSSPMPSHVTGKLRYQACNNQMCFRPASVDIQLPVVVR